MPDVSKALKIVRELNPLGLFSKATEEAAKLPQAKGTPEQMRAMLLKQGVKPDELKWTGFDKWAAGKKSVTRDEAVQFLNDNRVQVGETRLGNVNAGGLNVINDNGIFRVVEPNGEIVKSFRSEEDARRHIQSFDPPTKFSRYTLPGGENYREVLLTRPAPKSPERYVVEGQGPYVPLIDTQTGQRVAGGTYGDMRREAGRLNAEGAGNVAPYRSSHWDEPNVLAHLRLSDRYDPQGRKILHVEEIQSDWAQEGRKKGFQGGGNRERFNELKQQASDLIAGRPPNALSEEEMQRLRVISDEMTELDRNPRGLPSAPFVESTPKWTDLALKRALTEAAGGDYAGIAWTPGREQAKRYDLSKQVDNLYYKQNPDGTFRLSAMVGNRGTPIGDAIKAEELDRYVGKDVAERIIKNQGSEINLGGPGTTSQPKDVWGSLSGEGLRVGGEGMIGYYDKIVPTQLQKLTQPLDPQARIGTVNVPTTTGGKPVGQMTDADLAWELNPAHGTPATTPQGVQLPFLEMTPAMREKIKEGLPLFTMMPAAVGLGAASQTQEGANPAGEGVDAALDVVRRASGGRLLQDQYPTHYLPNVGRQVMADGGAPQQDDAYLDALLAAHSDPNADIREYQRQVGQIAQQPEATRAMTHAPSKPMRPIEIEGGFIGKRQLGEAPYDVVGPLSTVAQTAYGFKTAPLYFTPLAPAALAADTGEAAIDMAKSIGKGDYLGAGLEGVLGVAPGVAAYRSQIAPAVSRAVNVARDYLGRVPAPVAAGAAGAVAMTPEDAEAAKLRVPKGVTQVLAGTPENTAINAREALKRVVSPFSEDPESVKRALEIAATYRVPQGAEFGTGSYFRTKPSMMVTDVRPDIAPLPNVTPLVPRQMSWEDFTKEAKGGTLINVGGDRMNLGLLRDINNEKRLAWDVPLHAGPKYMLEPNPGLVWANAPGHTTNFNRIISEAAEKGPVYGVYAPMGPTAVDSSVDMFNAVMAQLPTSKITKKAAKEFDDFVKSGAFVQKVEDRPRMAETMKTLWPGIQKLKDPESVAKLADQLSGVHRGDLIKAMEKAKWRKEGFPEIGVTRVAVTDPALLSAPSNTIGHRIVRFDTEKLITPERKFAHPTYPTESVGQYVADVPLVQTQYGMPTALERILSKPTKSGEVMHPYSIDPLGRSSARKMFTEQKQVQPVDDQLIESIMLGLQRQKKYGFRHGGGVSHYAMMLAKEIGSSPRETVTP